MILTPRVVDISHHNNVSDFGKVAASGVWGIIHKATQGTAYMDPKYDGNRARAIAAGLLWGAYHFNTGDDVKSQVDWFLKSAKPNDKTLMVLDYEDNRLSNMGIHQAVEFLHYLEERTGRKGAIYSGNRLKENIGLLNVDDRAYVTSHRLWLCQYGPVAKLPIGFVSWWLWQFTGDGIGPEPHSVPGIDGSGIDINTFNGSKADLLNSWCPPGLVTPVEIHPAPMDEHSIAVPPVVSAMETAPMVPKPSWIASFIAAIVSVFRIN